MRLPPVRSVPPPSSAPNSDVSAEIPPPECCVKGCDHPQSRAGGALGLCPGHYQRMRRGVRLSKPLRRYRTAKKKLGPISGQLSPMLNDCRGGATFRFG